MKDEHNTEQKKRACNTTYISTMFRQRERKKLVKYNYYTIIVYVCFRFFFSFSPIFAKRKWEFQMHTHTHMFKGSLFLSKCVKLYMKIEFVFNIFSIIRSVCSDFFLKFFIAKLKIKGVPLFACMKIYSVEE